ncbi:MAG: N-acetyltransferase [Proteobacteria bacterium]|nr:N-acetyltransferase [Pseudomonadota bacterium]
MVTNKSLLVFLSLRDFVKKVEDPGAAGAAASKTLDVSYTKGKVTTDEDGSWYIGYEKISAKDAAGKDIGFVSYKIDPDSKTLTIGWSRVDEAHRGQGYQTELFKKMFSENPEIRTVRTSLDDVNQESFTGKLSKLVKTEKDYVAPAAPAVDQKHLDRLAKKSKVLEKELNECCAEYLANLQKSDPKRFEALLDEALKGTPAWKTREKFGFSEFGEMKNYHFKRDPKSGSLDFRVEFDATKPKP